MGIAETRRNHRVKAIQLGDIYSDTADAFYLLGLDASLLSVSKKAVAALVLVRHSLVRAHSCASQGCSSSLRESMQGAWQGVVCGSVGAVQRGV
jgi:hypothetical protein